MLPPVCTVYLVLMMLCQAVNSVSQALQSLFAVQPGLWGLGLIMFPPVFQVAGIFWQRHRYPEALDDACYEQGRDLKS